MLLMVWAVCLFAAAASSADRIALVTVALLFGVSGSIRLAIRKGYPPWLAVFATLLVGLCLVLLFALAGGPNGTTLIMASSFGPLMIIALPKLKTAAEISKSPDS